MVLKSKIKLKTIIEGLIALLIPVAYFFLLGGFKDKPANYEQNIKPYDPLSVIKIDFFDMINSGRYSLPENKSITGVLNPKIERMLNSQRVIINIAKPQSQTNCIYFKNVKGYNEKNDEGSEVIYVSSGNYIDGKEPMKKCYIAYNIDGMDFPLKHDTLGAFEWYLKPKMKIRKADFSLFNTRAVIGVITYGFEGSAIDSTIIKVKNFSDLSGKYDGSYSERYMTEYGLPGNDMRISSKELFKGKSKNGFNIRIFWFGEVDVWFEKLTMDDYMANDLLEGSYWHLIAEESSFNDFLSTANMIREYRFTNANHTAVNYVMNIMYEKLQTQIY